ncbi:MAG TPA: HAD hydrolase-like protein, partial [Solirubrobacterales bacterium]|nr:HAD hydrolase-like protein [Solirubrobacterales bacterium]
MMRTALNTLEAHSETTAMIGDRMDIDIVVGLEAGMRLGFTAWTTTGDCRSISRTRAWWVRSPISCARRSSSTISPSTSTN